MPDSGIDNQPSTAAYLLCYLLYALLIALGVAVIFAWQPALLPLIGVVVGRSSSNRALYQLGVLVLGIAMFCLVIGVEPYLRGGVERGRLLSRFARIAVPLAVAAAVGLLVRGWAMTTLG